MLQVWRREHLCHVDTNDLLFVANSFCGGKGIESTSIAQVDYGFALVVLAVPLERLTYVIVPRTAWQSAMGSRTLLRYLLVLAMRQLPLGHKLGPQ
jgi:hypothetical protein